MSAALPLSSCSRRPSCNHRGGPDGDLHGGGEHLAAECGPAAYPGHVVDGQRRGRLGVYRLYGGGRRRHANGALARGALWPRRRSIRCLSPSSWSA